MKTPAFLLLALTLAAAGCDKQSGSTPSSTNSASTNASSGGSVVTAPVDYLGALGRAQQSATKTIDVTSVDKAIQLFQADKGRNPKDLDELVQEKFLTQVPTPPYGTRLDYNPTTGQVKVVKQ